MYIRLEVKIFVWIILKRKILAVDYILSRGGQGELGCMVCYVSIEMIDHHCAECETSGVLLECLLPDKNGTRR